MCGCSTPTQKSVVSKYRVAKESNSDPPLDNFLFFPNLVSQHDADFCCFTCGYCCRASSYSGTLNVCVTDVLRVMMNATMRTLFVENTFAQKKFVRGDRGRGINTLRCTLSRATFMAQQPIIHDGNPLITPRLCTAFTLFSRQSSEELGNSRLFFARTIFPSFFFPFFPFLSFQFLWSERTPHWSTSIDVNMASARRGRLRTRTRPPMC